jgi:hypothetical protein
MKMKIIESKTSEYLYHVTYTDKIPKIKKQGLIPMNTSNWVLGRGDRYGKGEIYAFENMTDAARWAAKMDWDFNEEMGSGKISIIKFKSKGDWEEDINDPMSHASAMGKWVKKMERVMPENIVGVVPFTKEVVKKLSAWGQDIGDLFA